MKLYLLDRNVVILINDKIAGKEIKGSNKIELLERLKSLDQKGNIFSPLLSIMEGEEGRQDSAKEKTNLALKEAKTLHCFFKNARVDSDFIANQAQTIGETFSNPKNMEENRVSRKCFLRYAFPLLKGGVLKSERAKLERELIENAREIGINSGDPAVMAS